MADAATGKARKLLGGLNTVFDECALLCLTALAAEPTCRRALWQHDTDMTISRLVESM